MLGRLRDSDLDFSGKCRGGNDYGGHAVLVLLETFAREVED
jgi:hypothetical protein